MNRNKVDIKNEEESVLEMRNREQKNLSQKIQFRKIVNK